MFLGELALGTRQLNIHELDSVAQLVRVLHRNSMAAGSISARWRIVFAASPGYVARNVQNL